jgi:hypothetical protein
MSTALPTTDTFSPTPSEKKSQSPEKSVPVVLEIEPETTNPAPSSLDVSRTQFMLIMTASECFWPRLPIFVMISSNAKQFGWGILSPSTSLEILSLQIVTFCHSVNEMATLTSQYSISTTLHDIPNQSYIFTAYLLGFAAAQPMLGQLSDIFGRLVIFNATLFVFVVGTVLCGLAQVYFHCLMDRNR